MLLELLNYFCAAALSWLAGMLANWHVLVLRRRKDLWPVYRFYCCAIWNFPIFCVHRLGWYAVWLAFLTYGLAFLALWMDSRQRFPQMGGDTARAWHHSSRR